MDEPTHHCSRCNQDLPRAAFQKRGNRGGLQGWCRDCRRIYQRQRTRLRLGLPNDALLVQGRTRRAKPLGHTYVHKGYVMVKVGVGQHPRADRYGYVAQHILVAERKYGVPIPIGFTIHHRNGDRADNRGENLELRIGPHGKGADIIPGLLRDPDLRRLAREVLDQYDD